MTRPSCVAAGSEAWRRPAAKTKRGERSNAKTDRIRVMETNVTQVETHGVQQFVNRRARIALRIVQAGALAVVLIATTLHAFELDRFFVPPVAAFGFPLVLFAALRARGYWLWSIGAAITIASLVLTRSRAAWLAFAAVLVVFLATLIFTRQRVFGRLAGVALIACVA